jgi:DNA-binding NtrC family response regulator
LVEHFIEKKAREMGRHSVPTLVPGAIDRLMRYDWPGNVREVANVVERALIQSDGKPLVFTDLAVSSGGAVQESAAAQDLTSLRREEVETLHIRRMLEMTHGRIEGNNGAAVRLGINPRTLRARMRKLRIPFGRKENHERSYLYS